MGCRTVISGVVAGATLTTGGMTVWCAVDVNAGGVDSEAVTTGGGAGAGALVVLVLVSGGGGTFIVGGGPPACAALHCASSARIVSIKF